MKLPDKFKHPLNFHMSFDEIRLPASVIADIYANSLVCLPQDAELPAPVKPTPPAPLHYLGGNRKNIAVLVNYPAEVHLPEHQLSFIQNIFKACELYTDHLAILNTARQQVDQQALKGQLAPKVIMIFGNHSIDFLQVPEHFTLVHQEGTTLVCAPELEKLNRNDPEGRLLKSRLWLTLKLLFNV